MSGFLKGREGFNDNISGWNVSQVTISNMGASSFYSNLGSLKLIR